MMLNNDFTFIRSEEIPNDIRQEHIHSLTNKIKPLEILTNGTVDGWVIGGKDAQKDEINIFLMGTAGAPLFGGHSDISEGGDVLCNLALQKALEEKKQVMIMRGVGTAEMSPDQPIKYLENPYTSQETSMEQVSDESIIAGKTEGDTAGNLLGSNIENRIQAAMERYFIPQMLQMILNGNEEIKVNITGHSRGAITAFAMADCIDQFITSITKKNMSEKEIKALATQICTRNSELLPDQVEQALKTTRMKNITPKIRLLAYDPVEGRTGLGTEKNSFYNWSADYKLSIFGRTVPFSYSRMPSTVLEAKLILAHHEYREAFQPTIPTFDKMTDVKFLEMVGGHGTMKGNLSDHSNSGQDSYAIATRGIETHSGRKFIREAGRAVIDLGRMDVIPFLFKQYPPFLTTTLLNIFTSNEGQGYLRTKNRLFQRLSINHSDSHYNELFVKINKNQDLTKGEWEEIHQLFETCKENMRGDQEFTKALYFDLARDVHDLYLNPKDEEKRLLLGRWFHEMKIDTTIIKKSKLGNVQLLTTDPKQARRVWLRDANERKSLVTLTDFLPSFKYEPRCAMLYPDHSQVGGIYNDLDQRFTNPYLFDLEKQLDKQNLTQDQLNVLDKFALNFNELNQIGVQYSNRPQEKLKAIYEERASKYIDTVMASDLPHDIKVAILGTLAMKSDYQYKICNDFVKEFIKENCIVNEVVSYCDNYHRCQMCDLLVHYPSQQDASSKHYREIIKTARVLLKKLGSKMSNSGLFNHCVQLCDSEAAERYIQLDRQIQKYKKAIWRYRDPDGYQLLSKAKSASKGALVAAGAAIGVTAAASVASRAAAVAAITTVAVIATNDLISRGKENPAITIIEKEITRIEKELSKISLTDMSEVELAKIEKEIEEVNNLIEKIGQRGIGYLASYLYPIEATSKTLLIQAKLENVDRAKRFAAMLVEETFESKKILSFINDSKTPEQKAQMMKMLLEKLLQSKENAPLRECLYTAIKEMDVNVGNVGDENGNTLLHLLVENGELELLREISIKEYRYTMWPFYNYGLKARFDLFNVNEEGLTPIMVAVFNSNCDNLANNLAIIDLLSAEMDLDDEAKKCYKDMAELISKGNPELAMKCYHFYITIPIKGVAREELKGFNKGYRWEEVEEDLTISKPSF